MNDIQFEVLQVILLLLILLSVNLQFIKSAKLIGKRSVTVIIHTLSKLVPKARNLVVFGGENGQGFRGNTKYLFLEMVKDPNLRCIWIAKNQKVIEEVNSLGYEAYMVHSMKGIISQLRAKLIIHSHSINDDFSKALLGGATSYLTWHGVGLKKVWGANKSTFSYKILNESKGIRKLFGKMVVRTNQAKSTYVVSTSPRVSSYYPETFLVPKEHILELGQVRNDVFFKETIEDHEIPAWIREEKIILYMPTHRKFGKLEKDINTVFDFQRLNEFCKRNGYKFLVKRHMYSSGELPTVYPNIIDISHEAYDPQLLLKYTDVLVTDYSSCYTDFLLLNRPVLFFCYDLDMYLQKSNEMYFNYFDVTPGPKSYKFADFLVDLEITVKDNKQNEAERKRVLNIFYSKENQKPVLDRQLQYIYRNFLKNNSKLKYKSPLSDQKGQSL